MRLTKNLLALIVLAIGALWSLQGIGVVGGSFMTGQSQWLYIGLVAMLVGLAGLGEPVGGGARLRCRTSVGAPLCPAGHLPHKGGDWQLRARRLSFNVGDWRKRT